MERDCPNCIRNVPDRRCDSWDCEFISRKDAIEAYKKQSELMRREGQKWYGYKCSKCNFIYKGNALTDFNYCPNCGAKMEGEEK